jgi:hypothetical protein
MSGDLHALVEVPEIRDEPAAAVLLGSAEYRNPKFCPVHLLLVHLPDHSLLEVLLDGR